jgi:hypothetical protein
MRDSHGEVLDSIREEQKLSDENQEKLDEALENFNENFEPDQSSLVEVSVEDGDEEEQGNGEEEEG